MVNFGPLLRSVREFGAALQRLQYLPHISTQHSMVNFGPLTAEIALPVWAPLQISTASRLGSVTARHSSSARQPNFAALNRGRHLYSAGRPSRWALAHILVQHYFHHQLLEMWANAQRDGRPAEYRWRPLFNAAKFG